MTSNQIRSFSNSRSGSRQAFSFSSGVTGNHFSLLIVDDAHRPSDHDGERQRQKVISSWTETIPSRLLPAPSAMIVSMQRTSHLDLAGHIISHAEPWEVIDLGERKSIKGWVHINLPMVAESDHEHPLRNFDRQQGNGHTLGRYPEFRQVPCGRSAYQHPSLMCCARGQPRTLGPVSTNRDRFRVKAILSSGVGSSTLKAFPPISQTIFALGILRARRRPAGTTPTVPAQSRWLAIGAPESTTFLRRLRILSRRLGWRS